MSDASRGSTALVCGGFVVLTILLTWPQAIRLDEVFRDQDTWFNMWRIAWVAHALRTDPWNLFNTNIFWPERDTLAYSDAVLVEGVLTAPLLWAGVPTPIAYNLLVLGSFVFAACAAFLLARHLTGSLRGAVLAGIVFGFTTYRYDHYMHLELLWSGWMPLALLALHRTFETRRVTWGIATGLFVALQTMSSIYYGVFLVTVMAGVALVEFVRSAPEARRRSLVALVAGAVVAGAMLWPYMQPYRRAKAVVGERSDGEVQLLSAGPKHYLASTPGNWLYGRFELGGHEKRLFPGALALALVAVGLWPPFDRRRVAYVAGLLLAVNLSFGANGIGYAFLRDHVEAFRGLRVPPRAAQAALLMIAVLAAFGFARLERWRGRLAAPLFTIGVVVMCVEYAAVPLSLVPVPGRQNVSRWLAEQPRGVVLHLPMPVEGYPGLPGVDPEFAYQSTFHWQPMINGYSGNLAASYVRIMRALNERPPEESLEVIKNAGVRYLVLHERHFDPAVYRFIRDFLTRRPDLSLRGTFRDEQFEVLAFEAK